MISSPKMFRHIEINEPCEGAHKFSARDFRVGAKRLNDLLLSVLNNSIDHLAPHELLRVKSQMMNVRFGSD